MYYKSLYTILRHGDILLYAFRYCEKQSDEVTMFVSLKKQNVIRHLNFSFQTPSWFLGGYLKRKIS